MPHFTKVRFYYLDAEGKKKAAPAHSVVFDLSEDTIEDGLSRDYIREATLAEIAEADPTYFEQKAEADAGAVEPDKQAPAPKAPAAQANKKTPKTGAGDLA